MNHNNLGAPPLTELSVYLDEDFSGYACTWTIDFWSEMAVFQGQYVIGSCGGKSLYGFKSITLTVQCVYTKLFKMYRLKNKFRY